ncbi:MAG: sigma-54-dependent Fis family transcriptional regulator, partial [bacterium]|nr:sigma-54-dependent Fis family transcriptional regulator [bacterium]
MPKDRGSRDPLDTGTRPVTDLLQQPGRGRVFGLTVLCHPDADRVGEVAVLPALLSGKTESLSRREPLFVPPTGGTARPLADPRLSRKCLGLAPGSGDAVVLDPGQVRTPVTADGEPVAGRRELPPEALERGVVLVLARRVVLLLHPMEPVTRRPPSFGMVGESARMVRLRREIEQVVDLPHAVLLRGETGTGKELVARALHDAGPRRKGPFVAVNVGEIPRDLAASELFGADKGAFTGAFRQRSGFFQRAAGGTLFLDEIGEAELDVQKTLLRVLETGKIQQVGAEEGQQVDVRVVAATDVDLEAAAAAGRFRSQLRYRLGGCEIELPPLRWRRDDFGRLFFHFLHQELRTIGETGRLVRADPDARPWVSAELVGRLAAYHWPGNVREVRNIVRELVVHSRGEDQIARVPKVERLLRTAAAEPRRPNPCATRRTPAESHRDLDD